MGIFTSGGCSVRLLWCIIRLVDLVELTFIWTKMRFVATSILGLFVSLIRPQVRICKADSHFQIFVVMLRHCLKLKEAYEDPYFTGIFTGRK